MRYAVKYAIFAFQVYLTKILSNSSKCNFITSKIILLSEITLQE